MQKEKPTAFWGAKSTDFSQNIRFKFWDKELNKKTPLLMGIINMTTDSFYSGSRFSKELTVIQQVDRMLLEGADIIDIGAVSTRPGANAINENEELQRLMPVIESLIKHFPEVFISVDTYRSSVAKAAINAGACMINDISGGTFDHQMPSFIGKHDIPYVLMHIHGRPETMQLQPLEKDVVQAVKIFFKQNIELFQREGAKQIVLDPGFGFGKSLEANYTLLASLSAFKEFDVPLLVGISRKSMINKVLGTQPEDALNGTTALHVLAIMNGADILRVHDIGAAAEAVKLCQKYFDALDNSLHL